MEKEKTDNQIIRMTVIGCIMTFFCGALIGIVFVRAVYYKEINHSDVCQEKALLDSIANIHDQIDRNTVHLCNDSLEKATAEKIRNFWRK